MNCPRELIRIVIATGISSVATQLYTIRELLTIFQGNEFVIALIFFNWLILGSIGTFAAHRFTGIISPDKKKLAIISLVLASLPCLQILAIRVLPEYFFTPGTSVGFSQTFVFTFFVLAPYCLLLGFVLPFTIYVINEPDNSPTVDIYLADNLGDLLGGLLFSFICIYFLTPLTAVLLANIPLILATILLFKNLKQAGWAAAGSLVILVLLLTAVHFEEYFLDTKPGKLIFYKESPYSRIEAFEDHEQITLFADGRPLFSSQNQLAAEETIHFPLAQQKEINKILLISARAGILREIEKYQARSIDLVEIDPELSRAEFSLGFLKNKISGLNIIHQDGLAWLRKTENLYDAIIFCLPEPDTFQVNRFYTDEAFSLAQKRLNEKGILSFSLKGYDNYITKIQAEKISSLYNTAKQYFKYILLIPGEKVFFLCSSSPLSHDIPALLKQKQISADFIIGFFYGNISMERINYLKQNIDLTSPVNYIFSPRLPGIMFKQWFSKYDSSIFWLIAPVIFFLISLFKFRNEDFIIFSTGYTVMGCEIIIIFIFQIFYGALYSQIGIIVSVFLAGLLPGAVLGNYLSRANSSGKYFQVDSVHSSEGQTRLFFKRKLLFNLDLGLILSLIIFQAVLIKVSSPPDYFLLILSFIVSFLCGCQFPVAFKKKGSNNEAISSLFSADLAGAAFGTLITSIVLIPYLGILWALNILIGFKIISSLTGWTRSDEKI
jgi:spermidine synthase